MVAYSSTSPGAYYVSDAFHSPEVPSAVILGSLFRANKTIGLQNSITGLTSQLSSKKVVLRDSASIWAGTQSSWAVSWGNGPSHSHQHLSGQHGKSQRGSLRNTSVIQSVYFQNTHVWFPTPGSGSPQAPVTPAPRNPMPYPGLIKHLYTCVYTNTEGEREFFKNQGGLGNGNMLALFEGD